MTEQELVALAIIKAMRNDPSGLTLAVKRLRELGLDDYEINEMFQDIGRLIFSEPEPQPEEEEYDEQPETSSL